MPELESEWFPSAPLASISSNLSTERSETFLSVTRKLSLMKKLSLPPYSNSNLSVMSTLTRTSSCRSCARKVTWQKSSSSESLSSKYSPFQYSLTEVGFYSWKIGCWKLSFPGGNSSRTSSRISRDVLLSLVQTHLPCFIFHDSSIFHPMFNVLCLHCGV